MGTLRSAIVLCIASGLGLGAVAGPGKVWVVDDDGGPGVDATDIGAAIALAADGDTILVRSGAYTGFALSGKGLGVIADDGAQVDVAGGIEVRQVGAASEVVLQGLQQSGGAAAGLLIEDCDGLVLVESCTLRGADGDGVYVSPTYSYTGHPGARVLRSVAGFRACDGFGGDGPDYVASLSDWGPGGPGLAVEDASVAVFDSSFFGGDGGSVWDYDAAYDGAQGGHGVEIVSGYAYVSGSGLFGGQGGTGGQDFDIFGGGYDCGDGGDGGWGLHQPGFGAANAKVRLLDDILAGGSGGAGDLGYGGCPDGSPGGAYSVPLGTVTEYAGPSLGFGVSSPVRENGSIDVLVSGPAGAPVGLGFSLGHLFLDIPGFSGVLLVDSTSIHVIDLGVIPPGGVGIVTLPLGANLPPGTAVTVYAQGVMVSPVTGSTLLGPASSTVVLDSAF